jgi:simple sugar transport system ATP-binding protein
VLEARGVSKSFPGVKALDAVDFQLRRGEVHALMGENGAGKSTLIKVLTGVYERDAGEIALDGSSINPRSPHHAQTLGISTVYQEVNLIPYLSVAENLLLGRQPRRFGLVDWRRMRSLAETAMARLDIQIDVTRPLVSYSIAIQQMVAIARAIDSQAKVLVLDEPTSSLDRYEVEQLFTVIGKLKQDGLGIVFVSHFLEQIYAISDRITVLRNGRLVGQYNAAELPRLELISKMIGKELVTQTDHATTGIPQGEPTWSLRAVDIGRNRLVGPLDLEIRDGQIVGLAGLLGSGRTETARLLFGIERADRGTFVINDTPVRMRTPRDAVKHRLGFSPEDRKREGILPDLSLRENIVLALQARRGWLRPLSRKEQQAIADNYIQSLKIATSSSEKPIRLLSGGNQQKGIVARWLASEPRLLILDEPTRGIDVGAKFEMEKLVKQLCKDGMAILLISSELDEVARDSHRVVVLRDRRKVAELEGAEIQTENIMRIIATHEVE